MQQLVLDIAPAPAPTLDNFVPGSNAELVQLLRQVIAGTAEERCIYLWGAAHSGRTHLLQAVARAQRASGRATLYCACSQGGIAIPAATGLDCAVFDDVQHLDEQAQIELFALFNGMRESGGVLLASGNAPPPALALRADLVTRLSWGLVYQLYGLDDVDRSEALKRHAEQRGLALAQPVIDYLLRHERRDLATLIAVVDALDRYSLQTMRPITVPMLRELLRAHSPG
jgi:DnaA family protein